MQKTLLLNLLGKNKNAIFVASLGTISYDLKEIQKEEGMFPCYFVPGAMGCVLGIGLGLALNTKKKVVVFIGDGSFLMKLGSIATILKYRPKNLEVHVIQNNSFASTGNQEINFPYVMQYIPPFFKIHHVNI